MFFKQYFLFILLFYWYSFAIVKSSTFFVFDKQLFETTYYIDEKFTIGANFVLPSSFECHSNPCLVDLKLTFIDNERLLKNLWCHPPAIFKLEKLSCILNSIDAKQGTYRLAATVQASISGNFTPVLSAEFPDDSKSNEIWISRKIAVINPLNDQQQQQQPVSFE